MYGFLEVLVVEDEIFELKESFEAVEGDGEGAIFLSSLLEAALRNAAIEAFTSL